MINNRYLIVVKYLSAILDVAAVVVNDPGAITLILNLYCKNKILSSSRSNILLYNKEEKKNDFAFKMTFYFSAKNIKYQRS